MHLSLKLVTEEEFYNSELPALFDNTLTNRRFGLLASANKLFKMAWQSDLVKPVITEINDNIFSVGIDQDFAIIDVNKPKILLQLNLFYNFFDTLIYKNIVIVVTELEIIKIDRLSAKILGCYGLPDFFEELVISDNALEIKCSGGNNIYV